MDVMDIAPLIVWAAGITTLLNLANMLWSIFSGPTRKLTDRLAEAETRLREAERRAERHSAQLAQVSHDISSLPGHQALHQMELSMARLEGNISVLTERLIPVAAIAEKMQEMMLQQGKG